VLPAPYDSTTAQTRNMSIRLGLILIVRDEADVITRNLAYHARCGFDQFIVMDNGSLDGTRERLEALASEYRHTWQKDRCH
jgi:uncharacterized protein (DUF934 family)